ncbi:MAG: cbb3-type cytochrome c oxidase subunit I [Acidimicrobiales bacterium]|nr:cbb3-type cytochrome c oxidase subunit I [Acidimicrobiales bacterium]
MAVTETPPETTDAASETGGPAPRPQPTGLAAVLGTGDHKVIGRIYIVASLLFGALIIGLGEALAIESIEPETNDIFPSDTVFQAFTLQRLGGIFLLALPLVIGVAMVVVPLQVGSRTIAFPRAAAASLWGWLLGSALLIASYLANGGPGGGSAEGVDLWIASMALILVSLMVAAVCLATTVFALRTTGLSLGRLPLYAWSVLTASILWLVTLPVLFGLLVLAYVDHRHAGGIGPGDPGALYGATTWMLRNPAIYIVAIPVLGFVGDVLATTSGARLKMRPVALGAIAAFATFSFGAFLVVADEAALESPLVVVLGLVAVLPVLALAATVADTFRTGSFKLNASVAYALGSFAVLLVAVLGGAVASIPGVLDAPDGGTISNNIAFMGVAHAAIIATVIAALGGLTWWATKVGRQPAQEGAAMLAAVVLTVGGILTVVGDMVAGVIGEGAELVADYTGGTTPLNVLTAVGIGIVILGVLVALASLRPLLRRSDDEVPADPWEGQSLEWLAPSPPPLANFDGELAVVGSAEPLIDLREEK